MAINKLQHTAKNAKNAERGTVFYKTTNRYELVRTRQRLSMQIRVIRIICFLKLGWRSTVLRINP